MPERPSPDERLAAIHAQLVDAVENLVHSEAWATMLTIAARFPTYSPSNVLLIATQRPDATRVAGIRTWNSLGRRVTKGEHGIAILAPCIYRQLDDDTTTPPTTDHAGPGDDAAAPARVLRGFKIVHVFDITQTDGDPVPDNTPELLLGDAPAGLWDHLAGLVREDGYTLDRGGCPPGVNGYTDFTSRRVRVREDVDPAQAVKTLAHELGHIRADHTTRFPEYASDLTCRGQAEVEAESIAYIVTTHAGMVADPYTVPYVAAWADGALDRLRQSLSIIIASSRSLLRELPLTSGVRPPSLEANLTSPASVAPQPRTLALD
ncbi:ArdC-like ssDNA-binding domain-containing protein [Cellulomonas soli]|uniref:N-terminal domain-containing protein n=1 Tax=Cellulomonas soli TaxID=931535 RepID=A0A512P9K8_9CELL|nr:ArdC-like ssDNA-binding domain-containing protein [Cellulomonas soli]NYI60302.1 antirestriction protein ArdC [Cellulomonas soli]GEP67812.1 hypothetical protein CSO01_05270 [Cellulomonas soli]